MYAIFISSLIANVEHEKLIIIILLCSHIYLSNKCNKLKTKTNNP